MVVLGTEEKTVYGYTLTFRSLKEGLKKKFVVDGFGNSANVTIYATRDSITLKSNGMRVVSRKDMNALAAAIIEAYTAHELLRDSDGQEIEKAD